MERAKKAPQQRKKKRRGRPKNKREQEESSSVAAVFEPGERLAGLKEEGDKYMVTDVVEWPAHGAITRGWVMELGRMLERGTETLPPRAMAEVVPVPVADSLIAAASKIMHKEPNCVRVEPPSESCSVVLVGDVHGQFHDLLNLFKLAGWPDDDRIFVFNGDYVDRGAWGFETYFFLLAWKVLLPHRVYLLRGNHETKYCTGVYGFEKEISVKFGEHAKHVYRKLLGCFEGHPLAAVIAGKVFMAHGGLFRSLDHTSAALREVKALFHSHHKTAPLKLGDLEDLAKARRGVLDPSSYGSNAIPGDVLWSDPSLVPGITINQLRGIGLYFGPDCTQEFLEKHGFKLIVRSHEGPDARMKRPEMAPMNRGYTIDHDVKAGQLITLFSAPDYPQFQDTPNRFDNDAAYIVLRAPDFCEPDIHVFEAVSRPEASPYYDHANIMDSDEELDLESENTGIFT